jgi:hypothetical protein
VRGWPRRPLRPVAIALFSLCVWIPVSQLDRSYDDIRAVKHGRDVSRRWCFDADMPDRSDAPSTRVYLLAPGDFNSAVNLPYMRWLRGEPLPRSYRRLSVGPLPVDVTRTADRTLELAILTMNVVGTAVPSLYRAADEPMRAGQHFALSGLNIDVLEVLFGNPTRLRFTFDRSVDDPSLWFLIATENGLRHSSMPAIGATVRVPHTQYRDLGP